MTENLTPIDLRERTPQLWAVTDIEHRGLRDVSEDCLACLALAELAAIHAAVTGSSSATYEEIGPYTLEKHSCTVIRAITTTIV